MASSSATGRVRCIPTLISTAIRLGLHLCLSGWTSTSYWLKHPYDPTLNTAIRLVSPATSGASSSARQGVFQPLGVAEPVAVSDERTGVTGTLRIRCDTDQERADLDDLLESNSPLLFQTTSTDYEPDRWIAVGNHSRQRIIDQPRSRGHGMTSTGRRSVSRKARCRDSHAGRVRRGNLRLT